MSGLVDAFGGLLARRTSRRGALSRAAVAGAAFAVAPVRYLVKPGTAWAVLRPQDCPHASKCRDGYTAFCCEIEQGNNACPPDTYIAGWWKCTSYKGHGLCAGHGARYYVDCNRVPGTVFPGGCQCAQCNTQIAGTTEVVCRLVLCRNPATVPGMNCNGTVMVDNRTCTHENPCLKGLAGQLPGGGGGA